MWRRIELPGSTVGHTGYYRQRMDAVLISTDRTNNHHHVTSQHTTPHRSFAGESPANWKIAELENTQRKSWTILENSVKIETAKLADATAVGGAEEGKGGLASVCHTCKIYISMQLYEAAAVTPKPCPEGKRYRANCTSHSHIHT